MDTAWRSIVGLALVVVGGCGPTISLEDDTGADAGSTTAMTGPPSTTSTSSQTTTPPVPTTATEGGAEAEVDDGSEVGDVDTGAMSFLPGVPDAAPGSSCDVFAQDCPEGEKCMPWANDGGVAWNDARCVPIAPAPNAVGDPCMVEGSPASGFDDCDGSSMCWDVDPETLQGECTAFCEGDVTQPVCHDPDTSCVVANNEVIVLCLPTCDPLLQDCDKGEACHPAGDGFHCVLDVGESGPAGSPCDFALSCEAGTTCLGGGHVPDCPGPSCCSTFCNLSDEDPGAVCLPGQQCLPWYEDPFFGYRHYGICGVGMP